MAAQHPAKSEPIRDNPAVWFCHACAMRGVARFAWLLIAVLFSAKVEAGAQARRGCSPEGAEARTASTLLGGIDVEVGLLEPDSSVAHVLGRIRTLLDSPCYAGFRREISTLPDTAPALQWWWNDAGAAEWFAFYLVDPDTWWGPSDKLHIAIPPSVRQELSLETGADSEFAEFLCPRADQQCGTETLGWIVRAEQAFDSYSLREGLRDPPFFSDEAPPFEERCASAVLSREEWNAGRYSSWRSCVEHKLGAVDAFPIGRFRAPSSGWITFEGRRGHYEFCDQLSMFDLDSGSAVIAKSCGALVLRQDGSVDFAETSKQRETSIRFGSVPVENLRELALVTILMPAIHRDIRTSWSSVEVPPSVPDDQLDLDGSARIEHPIMTGTTELRWSWIRNGREPIRRWMDWGGWNGGAADHAESLLEVVEASFREGCVKRALPGDIFNGLPSVNRVDADESELSRLFRSLRSESASRITSRCCNE
jgi:hypothetical protein